MCFSFTLEIPNRVLCCLGQLQSQIKPGEGAAPPDRGCCSVSCDCCIPLALNELFPRAGDLQLIPLGKAELYKASAFTHSPVVVPVPFSSAETPKPCRHIPAGSKKCPWSCWAQLRLSRNLGSQELSPRLPARSCAQGNGQLWSV